MTPLRPLLTALAALLLIPCAVEAAAAGRNAGRNADPAAPVAALLERIAPGASDRFLFERAGADPAAPGGWFELSGRDGRIVVRGSDNVSLATGLHWYLKYHAGVQLSWDCMSVPLPDPLPEVAAPERHATRQRLRYAYNYCTFSYSMAFWDWERWEQEIDWMALHGINLPLVAVGMEAVWCDLLAGMGYERAEIDRFIAGPAFQAWWLMNNLEGWGGPSPSGWYEARAELAQRIVGRMRELDIEPVLPGYAGMVPSDARERWGLDVADPGRWCGYRRPAFLQPADPRFGEIAARYYEALERRYGAVRYFSCDPFHEGGAVGGVDLAAAGRAILDAMKCRTPDAVWVIQAWQANPHRAMIEALDAGDLVVLDLFSESRPQWGERASEWYRPGGFGRHAWLYCMLLNFGGNVGLYGKMDYVIDGYYDAMAHPHAGTTMAGIGMTPEGIGNNPVMFELLTELPWRDGRFTRREWLPAYLWARYGASDATVEAAWALLARSVYGCPKEVTQEGTRESVFCARPVLDFRQTSSWAGSTDYYDPHELLLAARLLVAAAERFRGQPHFEYDLVDVVRQAVAEKGRQVQREAADAFRAGDRGAFARAAARFMELIETQERLLATHRDFMLGTWLAQARALGGSEEEKRQLEWNARVQITTWGDRNAADGGGLRDYAHKEWSGLLGSLYRDRWAAWFDLMARRLAGERVADIDFYAMEEAWTVGRERYPLSPSGDCIAEARKAMRILDRE